MAIIKELKKDLSEFCSKTTIQGKFSTFLWSKDFFQKKFFSKSFFQNHQKTFEKGIGKAKHKYDTVVAA
jgi:hypothetical protein